MDKFIYKVTEANVDGCGGEAVVYVEFRSPVCEADGFRECLEQAKAVAEDKCLDTEAMVEQALEAFSKASGISGRLCNSPFFGEFVF